jgi:hypothetical protein
MKTAMTELIEYLEKVYNVTEIIDWDEYKIELFEKEREQIINAHTNAYLIGEDDISVEDANEASVKYYNQTYNQNK